MGWKFWERDTSEAEQSLARLQRATEAPSARPPFGRGDTITG